MKEITQSELIPPTTDSNMRIFTEDYENFYVIPTDDDGKLRNNEVYQRFSPRSWTKLAEHDPIRLMLLLMVL